MIRFIVIFIIIPFIVGLMMNRRMGVKLSKQDRKISGVAGGLAEHFGLDSTIVRIIMAILIVFSGLGISSYFAFALGLSKD